ncbi:MAG TPA: protein-L-isoaspartate(D-aspartate) O-methyltransferase [Thermoanaerobaculia bacterium]|nr:protein-L-isoaspartate(D-aspartate) O-methyltransferase [Thermoanaerobaculia bacterium]
MPESIATSAASVREETRRHEMVDRFVAPRGVTDARVLAAMRQVPRHLFVPEPLRSKAYGDHGLPIGFGQTISQPYVVGLMTQRLQVEAGHKVLEIGSGSGYQTAVLSRLARAVYSLERIDELARRAAQTLLAIGCRNASVKAFDGTYGYPAGAPFDRILVTAGTDEVPEPLLAQLAIGGRLVAPIGPPERQRLRVIRRRKSDYAQEDGEAVVFVPLVGKFARPRA